MHQVLEKVVSVSPLRICIVWSSGTPNELASAVIATLSLASGVPETKYHCLAFGMAFIILTAPVMANNTLSCEEGPVTKLFGGSEWLVYGCADKSSLVLVSAPHSQASPFVFFLHATDEEVQIHGEGTGDKLATEQAYKELKVISPLMLKALIAETELVAPNNQ